MKTNEITLTQIDELGLLLAQIKELEAKADAIKNSIKEVASMGGAKVVEGNLYKAVYSETNRSTVNWKKLAADFNIPASAIAEATSTTAVYKVEVKAR